MAVLEKLLLLVGVVCVVLAGWSLMEGELREAIFGFALGAFLLWCWRWGLKLSR
jgi:hypothetical protein